MNKFSNRSTMAPQQGANKLNNSTFVEKLMIGLEHAPPAFNLREQVIGAGGANLHYIRNETGAVATLRGRGSMFIDPALGAESSELLHLYIEHPRYEGLQAAKQLAKNLIETLQQELVHFQQMSQNAQNVTYPNGGALISQNQQVTQINVPPPMLAVPPPIIQQNSIDAQASQQTLVQQNFIQQNPPPTLGGPPQTVQSQPQTIIHQQIIPQTVPIQLQQGNMVIQQPVQQPPTIGNVNIPPPGIPIPLKTGQIVQFQQPPPPPGAPQLTQPPPNVAVAHAQPTATTQILLNPAQNYQYQYIQQPVQTGDGQIQPNQVTIQHVYQPQQQIQGIVQQVPPQSQGQAFDQFQQVRPQQFQAAPSQQYITVQGSTAYMVPPPTIIQQPPAQPPNTQITASNPNIIFQPPPQIQQVQMQMQPAITVQNLPPPPISQAIAPPSEQTSQTNGSDERRTPVSKEEIKSEPSENGESPAKDADDKGDIDNQSSNSNGESNNQPPTSATVTSVASAVVPSNISIQNTAVRQQQPQQQLTASITLPATQVPPPMMAVPPPITCVQHFMGNTLITTHPTSQTQTHQIYNQVPVSIQQIQPAGQQIHVSTPSGQHFVVNAAPQWQTAPPPGTQITQQHQMQHIQPNGTIQNVQITHQQLGPAGTVSATAGQATQQPPIMTFNPHHVQVQFQPQMLQQMPPPQTIESAQIISNQVGPQQQQFNVVHSQPTSGMQNCGIATFQNQQAATIMSPFPQHMKQPSSLRLGNKRKFDDDDGGPPNHQPRMGMGERKQQNSRQQQIQSELQQPPPPPPPTTSSSSGNGSNSAGGPSSGPANNGQDEINGQKSSSDGPQLMHHQMQGSMNSKFHQDNRPFYQREMNDSYMDGPQRPHFDISLAGGKPSGQNMQHGLRAPRFHHGNGMMGPGGYPPMRPPHHIQDGVGGNFPMHRINFGPPPPPPPYRGDCPPNMGGGYAPPPRFRGQW